MTRKGKKNLKKTSTGMLVNQYGVKFTEEEKKALYNAVSRVHRKRDKMLKAEAELPRLGSKTSTASNKGLQLLGKESDFIISKKTRSLQRFQTKDQYKDYMKYLKRVERPDYVTEKVREYKRNYMKGLDSEFGANAKDLKMKIRMMKPADFMKMIQTNENLEISELYPVGDSKAERLNRLRAEWGMNPKDDDESYEDEYYE